MGTDEPPRGKNPGPFQDQGISGKSDPFVYRTFNKRTHSNTKPLNSGLEDGEYFFPDSKMTLQGILLELLGGGGGLFDYVLLPHSTHFSLLFFFFF